MHHFDASGPRLTSATAPAAVDRRSVGRRWRDRRDVVILIAYKAGCSQRMLADVFDLANSRIAAIIKTYRDRHEI